jgi:hypothetical protein
MRIKATWDWKRESNLPLTLDSSQHLGEGLGVTAAGEDEWRTTSTQLWDDEGRRG